MKKLISMTNFVLQQNIRFANKEITIEELALSTLKYATFLSQKLELWMFVPSKLVGGKWVALEEPKISCATCKECTCSESYHIEYQEAKERCLFEDDYPSSVVEFILDFCVNIEHLARVESEENMSLTPTALKQIGLI